MRVRGFTMTELMVVVAIVGVLGALALPRFSETARTFRSREVAQEVLSALRGGRTLADKRNEPVLVREVQGNIALYTAQLLPPTDGYLVAVDMNDWELFRIFALQDVKFTAFPPDGIVFCPSGDARYRRNTTSGDPVCALDDLASPPGESTIRFEVVDMRYQVLFNAALATSRLRLDR